MQADGRMMFCRLKTSKAVINERELD